MQSNRQSTDTDTHGFDVVLKENLAGVEGAHSIFKHSLYLPKVSMWVFNQDIKGTI